MKLKRKYLRLVKRTNSLVAIEKEVAEERKEHIRGFIVTQVGS